LDARAHRPARNRPGPTGHLGAAIIYSPGSGAAGAARMAIEDEVSANAVKVHRAMKELGMIVEEKMGTAERITMVAKLPKTMVMNALQELQTKGWARRKVREKAAGYFLTK
jgi:hypothetical protein